VDIGNLSRSLNDHSVEYVLITPRPSRCNAYARATLDVDIFIRATPETAQRTRRALTAFGYDLSEVTDDELLTEEGPHPPVPGRSRHPPVRARGFRASFSKRATIANGAVIP
jgi:hypothetical protein